ncbi:uncharacterized protein [Rutidosis leptorrhynchoides]|uniref:uncharacterized protein n=1 Tax=Rutidosis leptorrhynchoides TaxID=125765 RepID=UPI003A99B1A9
MWHDLSNILKYDGAMWAIFGDFNEVRFESERKNTDFCEKRAKLFNDFIKDNSLIDLPLGGRIYTRISDNGRKFSKLDRFLVSENLIQQWPNINVMVLDKKHTDHCPLIPKDGNVDFGPKPVKVFDEWLKHKDSYDIIKSAWNLKVNKLRKWYSTSEGKLKAEIEELINTVNDWERKAENIDLSEEQHEIWLKDRECLLQKEKTHFEMLKQKARFKWALEGDENSKFFHSYIRRRNQKNNIHGVNVGGVWTTNPSFIKSEAFNFFQGLFKRSTTESWMLNQWDGPTLEPHTVEALEAKFTESEVIDAIKGCAKTKHQARMASISCSTQNSGILSGMISCMQSIGFGNQVKSLTAVMPPSSLSFQRLRIL